MNINTNASAIKAMEPLAKIIEDMTPDERANYKMPPGILNAMHYRAVQRIYGEQPGEQGAYVVDLLKKNPGVAIPVVLGRLHQKDAEWYVECGGGGVGGLVGVWGGCVCVVSLRERVFLWGIAAFKTHAGYSQSTHTLTISKMSTHPPYTHLLTPHTP